MGLIGGILGVAGKVFGTSDQGKLRQFQEAVLPLILKYQANYVQSESNGRWYQRAWRPALMFVLIGIIFCRYIVQPWCVAFGFQIHFDFPAEGWQAIMLLAPVAVLARTIDKRPGLIGSIRDSFGK